VCLSTFTSACVRFKKDCTEAHRASSLNAVDLLTGGCFRSSLSNTCAMLFHASLSVNHSATGGFLSTDFGVDLFVFFCFEDADDDS
jgi:hypothetical protein